MCCEVLPSSSITSNKQITIDPTGRIGIVSRRPGPLEPHRAQLKEARVECARRGPRGWDGALEPARVAGGAQDLPRAQGGARSQRRSA